MSMRLVHIVAASENDVIGTNNQLPWDIPEDMAFFKEKTKGRAIIMGRKTYDSMGRALPGRLNVVITRQKDWQAKDAVVVGTLEEAIDYCKTKTGQYGEEVYIIGGGEIYRQSLNKVDLVYLTRIHRVVDGDAKYPKLDPTLFAEIERRERPGFTFLTYAAKRNS